MTPDYEPAVSRPIRFALASIIVAIWLLIQIPLQNRIGGARLFLPVVAIVVAAMYAGTGPALLVLTAADVALTFILPNRPPVMAAVTTMQMLLFNGAGHRYDRADPIANAVGRSSQSPPRHP